MAKSKAKDKSFPVNSKGFYPVNSKVFYPRTEPSQSAWQSSNQPTSAKAPFNHLLLQMLQKQAAQEAKDRLPTFKLDKPTKPLTIATAKPVKPTYLDTGDTSAINSTGSSITDPTVTAQLPTVVEDVGATATGFRTKKSSRRMAKSGAQGYGSMKISTNTPFSSAINLG